MKRLVSAIILSFAAGCGGGTTTTGYACPQILNEEVLFYPVNGSIGVRDTAEIIIVGNAKFGDSWTALTLTPTTGSPIVSRQIVDVPSPVPDPHASFAPASATAFHIPPLAPQTTYSVYASSPRTGPCPPPFSPAGSFTTK